MPVACAVLVRAVVAAARLDAVDVCGAALAAARSAVVASGAVVAAARPAVFDARSLFTAIRWFSVCQLPFSSK